MNITLPQAVFFIFGSSDRRLLHTDRHHEADIAFGDLSAVRVICYGRYIFRVELFPFWELYS